MSAGGLKLDTQTNRMGTDTTQVGEDYNPGDRNSNQVSSQCSSDLEAAPTDNPYDKAPFQRNEASKSHSHSPHYHEELQGEILRRIRRKICNAQKSKNSSFLLRFVARYAQIGENTRLHYEAPKNGDAWQRCYEMAEKYDNEMCDAWKDEVDKVLIFAGLFSGAVTAFTTQSYQWLGEQPVDSSTQLLNLIALQLANSTNSLPPSLSVPESTVTQAQIRINVAWFLSLTLSLTTVLIGILCLQWLREFQRVAALPHKDAFALRQMRYEGLIRWHVPDIVSTLPLLLQLSLILFFIGLLDLLWSLNTIVAACVSAVVGMVMLFLITTTALPALQHALTNNKQLIISQCPYKSPQSWRLYRAGQGLFWSIGCFFHPQWTYSSTYFARLRRSFDDTDWLTYDMRWRRLRDATEVFLGEPAFLQDSDDIVNGLHWINSTFPQSVEAICSVYHSLAELDIPAATAAIFKFYTREKGLVDDAFSVMMEQPSRTEAQKRDVVAAYYLKLHQDRHPVLKMGYVETVIRILNTQDVPKPFYQRLSGILLELVIRQQQPLLALSPSGVTIQLTTEKIVVQVLLCVKSLIARDLLRTLDVVLAWDLLRRLLTRPPLPLPNHSYSTHPLNSELPNRGLGLNLDHFDLAIAFFEELEGWLSWGKAMDNLKSVKLCIEGMIRLFPPSVDIAALKSECPVQMGKAARLVKALDVHMSKHGGAAAVLRPGEKDWWHSFFVQDPCEVREWALLVNGFERLEGLGNG